MIQKNMMIFVQRLVPAWFPIRLALVPRCLRPSPFHSFHQQQARQYNERIIDHYENPRNVGSFARDDPGVHTGLVGAPACGDVLKLQVKIDENGFIRDTRFKTFGCGSAIASSSYTTEVLKGRHVSDATTIKNSDIAKHLSLPPVKNHCSMLAEDAIKEAVHKAGSSLSKKQ